jgi:hypothetical protein
MDDILARVVQNLFDRIDGPMGIRLIIQPIMATILATRDGIKDASQQHPPYGLSPLLEPEHRGHRLRDGWRSIRKVYFVALAARRLSAHPAALALPQRSADHRPGRGFGSLCPDPRSSQQARPYAAPLTQHAPSCRSARLFCKRQRR